MVKILHFADAHIDMSNYGRRDPMTGLPLRVMDFLKSLDEIIDTAISEKVDLVLFAGDAYKDRTPAPTYQREWGRRLMRLSRASIPTLLLVGNHDLSPALGRAHALEVFDTLEVPYIRVIEKPTILTPNELFGLPLQVLAIPWISRSGLIAALGAELEDSADVFGVLEEKLSKLIGTWLDDQIDHHLPVILSAHCSIQGAAYGAERTVMLGNDLVLSPALVKDPRLDYVALGHIHKPQNLNEGKQPPVIYPGSIERVDFGEAQDKKFFVIAQVEKRNTQVEWKQLPHLRPFIDCQVKLTSETGITERLRQAFPPPSELAGAIVRLVIEYPRELEAFIDDAALRDYTADAFEFHLVKRPQMDVRSRIPGDQAIGTLSPHDLLDLYWRSIRLDAKNRAELNQLAAGIIQQGMGFITEES